MEKEFQLEEEDYCAIETVKATLKRVLKEHELKPMQLIGFGNYLYALDRLPKITHGINSTIDISCTRGDNHFRESKSYIFRLEEEVFQIEIYGHISDEFVGGDGFDYPGWYLQADGYRETEANIWELEDQLSEFLNLGVEITVEDFSEIEYEEDE